MEFLEGVEDESNKKNKNVMIKFYFAVIIGVIAGLLIYHLIN